MASCGAVDNSVITFAYKFYEQAVNIQKSNLENTFLSPLSVYTALSMVMIGSDGTTKQEILRAMHMPECFGTHEGYLTLGKSLAEYFKPTECVRVNLANRLFADMKIDISKEFQANLLECFDGKVENINISSNPEDARSHINSWVKENTMNKITDLIPSGSISASTLAVLANALYFKGLWEHQFKKEDTKEGTFNKLGGSEMKVQFMYQKCECKIADQVLGASRMIRIPFQKSKWEMMILLPNNKDGLPQLLTDIVQPGKLESALNEEGFENKVDLYLPKFKLSGRSTDVINLLSALGMKTIFSSGADLSGITKTHLSISEIRHKAVLEVDEEGATAAAATAVMMNRCMPPPPIRIDHPFFVALVYNGNIPVFMGHVVEPENV